MLLDKLSKEISSSRTDDRNLEQIHPNRNQAHIFTIELKSKGENEDETYYAGNGMGKIIGKIDQRLQRKFEYTLDTHCMDIDETNIDVKVNDAKNEIFNVQLTDIKVKVIEHIKRNLIEITDVMLDTAANIAITVNGMLTKTKKTRAMVTGINNGKDLIAIRGKWGSIGNCYTSEQLKNKQLIPSQNFLEAFPNLSLVHILIQEDPATHVVIGVDEYGSFQNIYGVSAHYTNNIMMWTSKALEYANIQKDDYEITSHLEIDSNKYEFDFDDKSQIFFSKLRHLDDPDKAKIMEWCTMGLSPASQRKIRITGGIKKELLKNALNESSRKARFTAVPRIPQNLRMSTYYEGDPLSTLMIDVMFYSDLNAISGNTSFKTVSGHTCALVAVDPIGRGSWVENLRTLANDFKPALLKILIEVNHFGLNKKGKGLNWEVKIIRSDGSKQSTAAALKKISKDLKVRVLPAEPGKDIKILDRRTRELRAALNYNLEKCDGLIQHTNYILEETNRRLQYISSTNGTWASPFERYHGMVPSMDFLYPGCGASCIVRANLNGHHGGSNGIILSIDEINGTYKVYLPRSDQIIDRSDVLVIMVPRPYDGMLKMMMGKPLYDEKTLIEKHEVDLTPHIRGHIWNQDVTPYLGNWYLIKRSHLNKPLTFGRYGCICGDSFDTLTLLRTHQNKVMKTRIEDLANNKDPSHEDVKIRPKDLRHMKKRMEKQYHKIIMEELLNNPPKSTFSTLNRKSLLNDEVLSTMKLRNRQLKPKTKQQLQTEKEKKTREDNVRRFDKNNQIGKLKKPVPINNKSIECKYEGCLKLLTLTNKGKTSKEMKRHYERHERKNHKLKEKKSEPEKSKKPYNFRHARKHLVNATTIESLSSNLIENDGVGETKEQMRVEIETLDEMGFWSETEELPTPDSEVRTQRKNYKVKNKKFEVNAITFVESDFDAKVLEWLKIYFKNQELEPKLKVTKAMVLMCRAMYYGKKYDENEKIDREKMKNGTKPYESSWFKDSEAFEEAKDADELHKMVFGTLMQTTSHTSPIDLPDSVKEKMNPIDLLPPIVPYEVPIQVHFDKILHATKDDKWKYDYDEIMNNPTYFSEYTVNDDYDGIDIPRNATIPLVNTATVIIDPRVETGMKGLYDLKEYRGQYEYLLQDRKRKSKRDQDNQDLDAFVQKTDKDGKPYFSKRQQKYFDERKKLQDEILKSLTFAQKNMFVPKHTRDMIINPLALLYLDAMRVEIESLNKMGLWSQMKLPSGVVPIPTRFVFDLKWDLKNNKLAKAKARLIAQGFRQIAYDSYHPDNISSPVMKASSFMAILSLAAKLDLKLNTVDICNAFISAKLSEKVWIKLPSYLTIKDGKVGMPNDIAMLNMSLYGLKQSSSEFFSKLKNFLISIGCKQSKSDECLFTYTKGKQTAIIGCHVDDLLIASTPGFFSMFIERANKYFEHGVKHTDTEHVQFLGCIIKHDRKKKEIHISQTERIVKMCEMFKITRTSTSPMPTGKTLQESLDVTSLALTEEQKAETVRLVNEHKDMPNVKNYSDVQTYYRSYTGNMIYLVGYGRTDLQSTVFKLARYQENPSMKHIMLIRRVLQYCLYTKERTLVFGRQKFKEVLTTHSDASYADCPATGRSSGGYIHYFMGNYLASRSFKINCVTRSVTEAEFYTMSAAAADSIYFRNLYNETLLPVIRNIMSSKGGIDKKLLIEQEKCTIVHSGLKKGHEMLLSKHIHPYLWMDEADVTIYGDNSSAIQQANKGPCKRSKHIRIHKSYLWEQIHVFNNVRVAKIDTAENSADLQTKVLDSTKFEKHAKTIMGMNESLTVNLVELKFYKLD